MRHVTPLGLVVVLTSCLTACGGSELQDLTAGTGGTTEQSIINGSQCTEADFPTAMAIMVDATAESGGNSQDFTTVMCTGTLIAPDVVLTAAHCLFPEIITGG